MRGCLCGGVAQSRKLLREFYKLRYGELFGATCHHFLRKEILWWRELGQERTNAHTEHFATLPKYRLYQTAEESFVARKMGGSIADDSTDETEMDNVANQIADIAKENKVS